MVEAKGKDGKTRSAQKSKHRQQRFVSPVHTQRSSLSRCLTAIRTRATLADCRSQTSIPPTASRVSSPPSNCRRCRDGAGENALPLADAGGGDDGLVFVADLDALGEFNATYPGAMDPFFDSNIMSKALEKQFGLRTFNNEKDAKAYVAETKPQKAE